jgi:RNA-directed DNA polymerase
MAGRLKADDATLKASFAALKIFDDVAKLLDIPSNSLAYCLHSKANYKSFDLRKRSGGKRNIDAPVTRLKTVQANLNQVLQAVYGGRGPSHGFARRKGIVTNASKHLDREFVLNFDLQDFFPSIHFGRVLGMFEGKVYLLPRRVALTLARICCHNGSLPQGAPTSPVVSNMICAQLDAQLKILALENGCVYTRYADDITISKAHGKIPSHIVERVPGTRRWKLGVSVEAILQANKFKANHGKTRLLAKGYRQEVTGLVVNGRLNVKRSFILDVKATLHACKKWGVAAAQTQFLSKYNQKQRLGQNASLLRVLRGKIEFIGAVRGRDDFIYLRFLERYLKIVPSAKARSIVIGPNAPNLAMERAVWVLEGHNLQGSAFAVEGLGLVTAHHVFEPSTLAACPALSKKDIPVGGILGNTTVDVARCTPSTRLPVVFRMCNRPNLQKGDRVRILGYPLYSAGNSLNIQECRITSIGTFMAIPYGVVDGSIVKGASGGPVLDLNNEVIGIAVKGQGTPGKHGPADDLSRFVPIDFAIKYL